MKNKGLKTYWFRVNVINIWDNQVSNRLASMKTIGANEIVSCIMYCKFVKLEIDKCLC